MSKIKVCVISPGLPIPPTKGGAIETLIFETAPLYKDSSVTVFSEEISPEDTTTFNTPSVRYLKVPISPRKWALQRFLNRFARRGIFWLYDFFFIRECLRRIDFEPEIFHLHNNFYYAQVLRKRFPESKILVHFNNDFLFHHRYLYKRYINTIDCIDKIIATSQYIADQITEEYPACARKVVVVTSGVSLECFKKLAPNDAEVLKVRSELGLTPEDRVVIFVGRICEVKGVDILVRAFQRVRLENKRARLLVVGSTYYKDGKPTRYFHQVKKLAEAMGDGVIFTGFVSHNRLNAYYNAASIFVAPSVWNEPFGFVNLEAMAAGCAVIATAVGGIPEYLRNGETGILVPPGDVERLYEKIQYLLDNEDVRQDLAENGRRFAQTECGWNVIAEKLEAVYNLSMDDKRCGTHSQGTA